VKEEKFGVVRIKMVVQDKGDESIERGSGNKRLDFSGSILSYSLWNTTPLRKTLHAGGHRHGYLRRWSVQV